MVWVRPGVLLVLAILLPTSALIKLDFPTLERPRNAISGAPAGGNCSGAAAEVTKRVNTFMQAIPPSWTQSARSEKGTGPRPRWACSLRSGGQPCAYWCAGVGSVFGGSAAIPGESSSGTSGSG